MATTSVMYPHYKFAEDEDDPARRGLFDLAVDVFGGDYDPVIGALPSRVAMTDMLEGTKRALFVDNEGEKPVVIENYLEQKSQDFNSTWLRSSDFLRIGNLSIDRTKREDHFVDIDGDEYEALQSSLEGAADFDSQTTYFGYLLQSLVGYELDTHPRASEREGACSVVESVALDMISTEKKLQTHVNKIFETRNKATAVEDFERVKEQRNALLKAVQILGEKIREDATKSDASTKMIESLSDPKIAMIDQTDGTWIKDSFKENGDFAGVSLVDYLPTGGMSGLSIPTGVIDLKKKTPEWRNVKILEKANVPTFEVHEKGKPEDSEKSVNNALRVLDILIGSNAENEPGLLTRLARERLIFGQSLIKVRKACEKPYKVLKDQLKDIVGVVSTYQDVLYSEKNLYNAFLIGARRIDGDWSDYATKALKTTKLVPFGLENPALIPSAARRTLVAPKGYEAKDINEFLQQWHTTMFHMAAEQYALFGAAAIQIRSIRTLLVKGYENIAVDSFARVNEQGNMQRLKYTSSNWYSEHKLFWDNVSGVKKEDPDNAEYQSLTEKPNVDPSSTASDLSVASLETTLWRTTTQNLIDLLLIGPAKNISNGITSYSNEKKEYNKMTASFADAVVLGEESRSFEQLAFVKGHVILGKEGNIEIDELIVNDSTWKNNELSVKPKVFGEDGKLEDGASEIVLLKNVHRSILENSDKPLYIIPLMREYVGYLEGILENLLSLTIYCGRDIDKKRSPIFKPGKLTKEQEAAIKTIIRDESDAASQLMKLLKRYVSGNFDPQRSSIDYSYYTDDGKTHFTDMGFTERKKNQLKATTWSDSGLINLGAIALPPDWVDVETLEAAVVKIWNKLLVPFIDSRSQWVTAYIKQDSDYSIAKNDLVEQTKVAKEKSGEVVILTAAIVQKDNELKTAKEVIAIAENQFKVLEHTKVALKQELAKTVAQGEQLGKMNNQMEHAENAYKVKIQELAVEYGENFLAEQRKYDKWVGTLVNDKKYSDQLLKLEVLERQQYADRLAANKTREKGTPGVITKEPWEINLRIDLKTALEKVEFCFEQNKQHNLFQMATTEYARQSKVVYHAIEDYSTRALNKALAGSTVVDVIFGETADERKIREADNKKRNDNAGVINNKMDVLRVYSDRLNFISPDDIVKNMIEWAREQESFAIKAAPTTQSSALVGTLDLVLEEYKSSENQVSILVERNRELVSTLNKMAAAADEGEDASSMDMPTDIERIRKELETIDTIITKSTQNSLAQYTLKVIDGKTVDLIKEDSEQGERARNFRAASAGVLWGAMKTTGSYPANLKFPVFSSKVSDFWYSDNTSTINWVFTEGGSTHKVLSYWKLEVHFRKNEDGSYFEPETVLKTLDYIEKMITEDLQECVTSRRTIFTDLSKTQAENEQMKENLDTATTQLEKAVGEEKKAKQTLEESKEALKITKNNLALTKSLLTQTGTTITAMDVAIKKIEKAEQGLKEREIGASGAKKESEALKELRISSSAMKAVNIDLASQLLKLMKVIKDNDKLGDEESKKLYDINVKGMQESMKAFKLDSAADALAAQKKYAANLKMKETEITAVIKRANAELKERLAQVSKACKEDKDATVKLEVEKAKLFESSASVKEKNVILKGLETALKATEQKAFEAREKASKAIIKLEAEKRAEEGKRKIIEEANKALNNLANKRKSLATQIEEIREDSRAVVQSLEDKKTNEILDQLKENNEKDVAALSASLEVVFNSRIETVVEDLREATLAKDIAQKRLEFFENEIPDLTAVLEPVRELLENFPTDVEYAQKAFEGSFYGEIIEYGKAKKYIPLDTEALPFPDVVQLIKKEDGGFLLKDNVFTALEMYTSLGGNALENSKLVASVWDGTRVELETCLQEIKKLPMEEDDALSMQLFGVGETALRFILTDKRTRSLDRNPDVDKRRVRPRMTKEEERKVNLAFANQERMEEDEEESDLAHIPTQDILDLFGPDIVTKQESVEPSDDSAVEQKKSSELDTSDTVIEDSEPEKREGATPRERKGKKIRTNTENVTSKIPQATPTHKDARAASWNWFL